MAITSSCILLRLLHNSDLLPLFGSTHKIKTVNLLRLCCRLMETSYLQCLHDVDVCARSLIFQQGVDAHWLSLDPACFSEWLVLKIRGLAESSVALQK